MRHGTSQLFTMLFSCAIVFLWTSSCLAQDQHPLITVELNKPNTSIKPSSNGAVRTLLTPKISSAQQGGVGRQLVKNNTNTQGKAQSSKQVSRIKKNVPSAKNLKRLDLTLPREFAYRASGRNTDSEIGDAHLLPPMFSDKPKQLSPYQLSGKLITNERGLSKDTDYWDSVDGAELSIEFKN